MKKDKTKQAGLIELQVTANREKPDSELARINRSLRLLSSANELLIRIKTESDLLTELCELIVKAGGYAMAWVGYTLNDPEKSIKPVAHFGNFSHLKNIKLSWSADVAVGKGPAARAIRDGKAIVVEDISNDPSFSPWAESAIKNGYRGVIALPLIHERKTFGLLAMYSSEVNYIADSETELLQELADDLAFGIMNLRAQEESHRFHAALYKMAASVSATINEDFFHQLGKTMTEATDSELGFIAKLSSDNNFELQTVAVNFLGNEYQSFSFVIEPKIYDQLVNTDNLILYKHHLSFLAKIPTLSQLNIQNYIGHRLVNHKGELTGLVVVMFKTDDLKTEFVSSLLKIFAGRAGAELDRLNADRHIREQAALLDKAQDAIIVRGLDNKVQFWNKGAERLYGYKKEEAIDSSIVTLLYPDTTCFDIAMDKLLADGEWNGEILHQSKFPHKLIIESRWTLVYDDHGHPQSVFTISTDITDRKAAADRIQHLAFYDSLTNLPNRTLLLDRLKQALVSCNRSNLYGALLFIDLDNFKVLNDTLGHDVGDLLINEIGERLKTCVRGIDSVARFGGDEFVVMLEEVSAVETEAAIFTTKIAEKILSTLNHPYSYGEYEHLSTASIGITLFSNLDNNVNELLKRADLAMYQAKAMGRNTMRFFDPKMQSEITSRVLLESDLRHSLAKHQFSLHYQPQLNDMERVVGAEALIRWQHPERGMVPPGLFIPVAEDTRMILSIGHWVLETACAKLASWKLHPETSGLTLAVNVSVQQFKQPDFVEQVFGIIEHFGANPNKLKLELTESLFAENVEDIIDKMHLLKERGITFSLDDFGTGYSSLSYLKLMPLDQLKIDQSFIRDILEDPNDAVIARTIIGLAKSLGLEVIAEGVETEAQKQFLLESGCSLFQGYLFSKPLSVDSFEEYISKKYKTNL